MKEFLIAQLPFTYGCVRIAPRDVSERNRVNLVIHKSQRLNGRGIASMNLRILAGAHPITMCFLGAAPEPGELKRMIKMIRSFEQDGEVLYATEVEKELAMTTHGQIYFDPTENELRNRPLRPSLWIVKDVQEGEIFKFAAETEAKRDGNFDSICPSSCLHIEFADFINGKVAQRNIQAGDPMTWDMNSA